MANNNSKDKQMLNEKIVQGRKVVSIIYGKPTDTAVGFPGLKEHIFMNEIAQNEQNMLFWGAHKWPKKEFFQIEHDMDDNYFQVRWHKASCIVDSISDSNFFGSIKRDAYGDSTMIPDALDKILSSYSGTLLDVAVKACCRQIYNLGVNDLIKTSNAKTNKSSKIKPLPVWGIAYHKLSKDIQALIALFVWIPCVFVLHFDEGFGHWFRQCYILKNIRKLINATRNYYSKEHECDKEMCVWKYIIKETKGFNVCLTRQAIGGKNDTFETLDKLHDKLLSGEGSCFNRRGKEERVVINQVINGSKLAMMNDNYKQSIQTSFIINLTHGTSTMMLYKAYNDYPPQRLNELETYFQEQRKSNGPYQKINSKISEDKSEWKLNVVRSFPNDE